MSKAEIIERIGKLESELAALEGEMRKNIQSLQSSKNNRSSGALAALVGIIGFLFFSKVAVLWIFILLIGVLTWITAYQKQHDGEAAVSAIEARNQEVRSELAEMRARLLIH